MNGDLAMGLKEPIFIIGSHKSGSSLLRSLLDGHPDLYVVPTEIHYFQYTGHWVDYRLRHAWPKEMTPNEVVASLIKLVHRKDSHQDPYADSILYGQFDLNMFEKTIRSRIARSPSDMFQLYVEAIYASLTGSKLPDDIRIVEKSVENAEFAISLRQMFPDCKFIHIVRNPYASLVAIRRAKTRKAFPCLGDFILSLQNSFYYLFKNQDYLDNYLVVRYEDLLTATEEQMLTISDFLDLEFKGSLLTPTVLGKPWMGNSSSSQSFEKISVSPLNSWEKHITHLEMRLVNTFLEPILSKFGYTKLNPKISKYVPLRQENPKTYIKNRSLFWIKSVSHYAP
jgi:hypothetical protein